MRVAVVMGTGHGIGGATGQLVEQLLDQLRKRTDVEATVVTTDELDLGPSCPACLSCMTAGEQSCPNFERTHPARQAMDDADVVVFATPVHSFHVSATMKRFVDHFAYLIHRPAYFGTPAVLMSTAAGAGHDAALGYLGTAVRRWGFHVVGRLGVNAPGLAKEPYREKVDTAVSEIADAVVEAVRTGEEPKQTVNDLIGFRVARLLVESGVDAGPVDDEYWRARGWYDASWFTDRKPPFVPNLLAGLIERRIRSAIAKGSAKPFR